MNKQKTMFVIIQLSLIGLLITGLYMFGLVMK